MYQSAIHVGSRQFQQQARLERLCGNQDDQEERLVKLALRADDVDARYGDAIWKTEKATLVMGSAPTQEEYAALQTQVSRQGHAMMLLVLANLAIALAAVLR